VSRRQHLLAELGHIAHAPGIIKARRLAKLLDNGINIDRLVFGRQRLYGRKYLTVAFS
jgi:hypothetical protein